MDQKLSEEGSDSPTVPVQSLTTNQPATSGEEHFSKEDIRGGGEVWNIHGSVTGDGSIIGPQVAEIHQHYHNPSTTKQHSSCSPEDIESSLAVLRDRTWDKAEIISGERLRSSGLYLVRQTVRLIDMGDNIPPIKRICRPDAMETSSRGDFIQVDEFFASASEYATSEAKSSCGTEKARKDFVRRHGNVVGILGKPGDTKTVCRELAEKVLNKTLLKEVEFVFYIELKHVDCDKPATVLEFITTGCRIQWSRNRQLDDQVVQHLHERKILFIFDGLEEVDRDQLKMPMKALDILRESPVVDIIKYILCGDLFPQSLKLVSSRSGLLMYHLPDSHRPLFTAKVEELDPESKDKLDFSFCRFTDKCVEILCGKLMSFKHQIAELNLSYNRDITDKGVRELCPVLDKIQELNLEFCDIGTEGAKLIAEKVNSLPDGQVLRLNVKENRIEDDGVAALQESAKVVAACGSGDTNYFDPQWLFDNCVN